MIARIKSLSGFSYDDITGCADVPNNVWTPFVNAKVRSFDTLQLSNANTFVRRVTKPPKRSAQRDSRSMTGWTNSIELLLRTVLACFVPALRLRLFPRPLARSFLRAQSLMRLQLEMTVHPIQPCSTMRLIFQMTRTRYAYDQF